VEFGDLEKYNLDLARELLDSPGDRVVLVGVLRSYQRATQQGKSTAFDLLLDTVSFEIEEKGFEEIEVTKEDECKIQELGKDPEIYGKIIGSIAPSIFGYEEVKEAMALQGSRFVVFFFRSPYGNANYPGYLHGF